MSILFACRKSGALGLPSKWFVAPNVDTLLVNHPGYEVMAAFVNDEEGRQLARSYDLSLRTAHIDTRKAS